MTRAEFESLLRKGYTQIPLISRTKIENGLKPLDILQSLQGPHRYMLESTRISEEGHYSIIGDQSFLTFKAKGETYWIDDESYSGNPIEALRELQKNWNGVRPPGCPLFCGGAIGYFGYESNHYFEVLPRHSNDDLNIPDLYFLFVDSFYVVDHLENELLMIAVGNDFDDCSKRIQDLKKLPLVPRDRQPPDGDKSLAFVPKYESNFTKADYIRAVEQTKEYIRAGDTYQANLSQRLKVNVDLPPLQLYQDLSSVNPVHFASYFEIEDFVVISASPERLVRVENRDVFTRPIAGTRRRGTKAEDEQFLKELQTDVKEQAEHAMLVDLERNDLGRVCEYGSVKVSKLMEIIHYAHVMHIESEVIGRLAEQYDLLDVVAAVFPGGTITGVPKIRTMEIITEFEPTTRGVYTGSIGYLSFAGEMDLNIVIRTILLKDKAAYVQVGGGVVYDSNPYREYTETFNKARSSFIAIGGIVKKRKGSYASTN